MIVRKMQPEEFDSTLTLFHYYRDEAIESLPQIAQEYDENSSMLTIKQFATQWDSCWFNGYDNGRPVGFVSGNLSELAWNKNITIANLGFIYLLKSHRTIENFKALYNKFEEWAKLCEAKKLTVGDIGIDVERSKTIYNRLGYRDMLLMEKDI